MVDSLRYLQSVGEQVRHAFVGNKTILSFQEYMEGFFEKPRVHARDAAQYIRDCFDFYGTTTANNPGGAMRRFKLFDRPFDQGPGSLQEGEGGAPVCGHEEVQNAIYRILNGFVRAGRINKLILLHGPNGSAKSSIVAAIQRALEDYSRKEEGQLYRFNWIFPSEKLVKGSIGFGEAKGISGERVETYAHLEGEAVDARIHCELKDHPLHLVPRMERQRMLREATKPDSTFQLSQAMLEGELCHKCRQIYAALLQSYNGDVLKVLRHVQVERFYISRRYMHGAVTVEPQMAVDADYRQVTHDRSHGALPGALQNLALFEPYGPLVAGNRGVIEFSDLLKRPLDHYKYLLGTVETGIARMSHFLLHLDSALISSSNEKHLSAFKEMSDFASFKGRIELVRVPYLRTTQEEQQELVKDKSVYEFLQQEVVDGYHDHEEFVRVVENEHLDVLDEEVRDAMGLVSEKQYRELFERYVQHVLAWTRGERVRNKLTGEMERPDEEMMAQTEAIVMTGGEERREFRRALIANIGAHRIDHPEGEIDYSQILPDLFRRLRGHFFDERKRILRKNSEKMVRYLGDDRGQLSAKEIAQVESTLLAMKERFGYCDNCAKDALLLLLTKRYTD